MVTTWFPSYKRNEVEKIFFEAIKAKQPSYIKKWQLFTTVDGINGTKGYNLIMVEKGKVDEAFFYILQALAPFNEIEGHEIKIEPLLGATDAAKLSQS